MKKNLILLNNIRSIHNVGAFFRTADGAGFHHIYCCGYTPTPEDPRMHKVSLGAEEMVSWDQEQDITQLIPKLKKEGYTFIAIETGESAENIFSAELQEEKIAVLFGHEVDGIDSGLLRLMDRIFVIPMEGGKESLNVSVAGGIALYELQRKRRKWDKN